VSSGTDSRQDYGTPQEFITAVERRFGPIVFDLAAHAGNRKSPYYYAPEPDPAAVAVDALAQQWHNAVPCGTLAWLNPPFSDIAPWARKCAVESSLGARIALLVPAAVGANWFRDHVAAHAAIYLLNGRLSFDGKNVYPKDCLLAVYGETPGACIWDWRHDRLFPVGGR